MPSRQLKTLEVRTADDWRAWLRDHHDRDSEVWLVFNKRKTGHASIAYLDALDEALCFGWIDSLLRRLDDARYARKFTPRKPDSQWSDTNRRRYAALEASGRVMPPGRARPPTDRRAVSPRSRPLTVPSYMNEELDRHPAARRNFDQLPPSHRRNYIAWIDSAKQHETKMRRLGESIRMLTTGKRLGLK
jgi:uncharacterized protein YdeI (YjbR/CyaY-like superfamily)